MMSIYKIETEFATFEMERTLYYTSVMFKNDGGDIVHTMFSDDLHTLHAEDYVKRMGKQLMIEAKLKEYTCTMTRQEYNALRDIRMFREGTDHYEKADTILRIWIEIQEERV